MNLLADFWSTESLGQVPSNIIHIL